MDAFIEIETPSWPDSKGDTIDLARFEDFSGVVIYESGGVSAPVFAKNLAETSDKEVLLKISCRDRNRIALRSELATCATLGLQNIVLVDGEHPVRTRYPATKPVYDLDSLTLLRLIKQNSQSDAFSLELEHDSWSVGVCIGGATRADLERAKRFVDAEADIFFVRSFEAVTLIRKITDRRLLLSVPEKDVPDIKDLLSKAESAGADGVNILTAALPEVA